MKRPGPHEISGHKIKFMPLSTVVYFSPDTVSCMSIDSE